MTLWRRLADLPLLVNLMGLTAAAMLVPAAHALAIRQLPVSRAFFYSALILLMLTAMIAVATATYRARGTVRGQLVAVIAAYLVVPVVAAVPVQQAVPGLTFTAAWFEMLSSFTTTGATVFDTPDLIALPVHLWRAIVGWAGGFYILVSVMAVLAPLGLDGVEHTGAGADRGSGRVGRTARLIFPPYLGMTALLWLALLLAGDNGLIALCHAMSTLATSGISPLTGLQSAASGVAGEAVIFAGLTLAVTCRFWQRAPATEKRRSPWQDPEIQLACALVGTATVAVGLHHWVMVAPAGITAPIAGPITAHIHMVWGAAFTALSFLTTTGFQSADWPQIGAPGLILLGLAMIGGGGATAAGGIKLLRLYALLRHAERELERIIHPHSIGGHGQIARRLRREGAYLAWIFFMIFGLAVFATTAAFTLTGLSANDALVLAIACLTTTGQLAMVAGDEPVSYADLGTAAKAVAGAAMVLGRLEILAIFAAFAPNGWAR